MLIDPNKLLQQLEAERQKLMQDTFSTPPADYAGFQRAVGAYGQLLSQMQRVRELAKQSED